VDVVVFIPLALVAITVAIIFVIRKEQFSKWKEQFSEWKEQFSKLPSEVREGVHRARDARAAYPFARATVWCRG
jgi:hypothetical protein